MARRPDGRLASEQEGRGDAPALLSYPGVSSTTMRIRRFVASALLSLVLSIPGVLFSVDGARAANPPESDIPGIALPGAVVSGQLGGPIYDVVYQVQVPAGYVLVAGLSGTSGTDFDLYLFDSSATTVVGTTGLLTKSIGPASNEALSWPTRIGGTFYLDLNGATDVQGTYTLSVQVVPDPTPPSAVVLVAGGLTRVNTPQVSLVLAGFDDLSGVTEMSLSYDGLNYLPPEPLLAQFSWTLSDGDGLKRIWVRVVNGVGLYSSPVSTSVVLDTVGPTVTAVTPADGTTVTTARPTISVQFSEPIAETTWASLGLVVQSAVGGIVPGAYAYYPSIRTGTFVPSVDLVPGYAYFLTVGDVRDPAGNRVTAPSWTLRYLRPASVTAAASPSVVVFGSSVTLGGSVTLPAGESLQLEAREGGATAYAPVGPIVPSGGRYGLTLTPAMNTSYRVRYAGSPTTIAASAEVRVLVRRGVSLLGSGPSMTRTATAGRPVTITAQVSPAGVTTVSFRLYRYDASRGRYVYAGSFGRSTGTDGRASLTWTPSAGRWYWRVAVPSTAEFANNISPTYRYSVSR
ncbi:MAG: hypothetical protein C0498_05875 [Anaerolinea sp.]|nr:hypothetical protein [Anaerolinea sp.]